MAARALKNLEKAGQKALFAAARLAFPHGRKAAPDWDARAWRVLYLRYDRIGDMILATGLIRAIAQSHSTIQLDVLASPANAPVLEGNPHVHRVLQFDRRRPRDFGRVLRQLRAGRYDVVIDGMVLTPSVTTMLLIRATGAPWRIGIGGRRNDFVYSLPVPAAAADSHIIERSRQAAIPFGVDLERTDWRPELFLREDERATAERRWGQATSRLLLNVSAATADRRWPWDRYAALLRETRDLRPAARLLVISSPADRVVAARVAADAGVELIATAGVREAFALVGTADAVFTPDTSIAHAAAALKVPVAVMIRRGWIMGPYGAPHIRIDNDGPSLETLPLEPALRGMSDLLGLAGI